MSGLTLPASSLPQHRENPAAEIEEPVPAQEALLRGGEFPAAPHSAPLGRSVKLRPAGPLRKERPGKRSAPAFAERSPIPGNVFQSILVIFALLGVAFVIYLLMRLAAKRSGRRKRASPEPEPASDGLMGLASCETMAREAQQYLSGDGRDKPHALFLVALTAPKEGQEGPPGRQSYEELCRQAAQILRQLLGREDLLGYVDQGIFAVMLKALPCVGTATVKAADISDTLRLAGQALPAGEAVSCHIGISLFYPSINQSFKSLLREAEIALEQCDGREYAYYLPPRGAEQIDESTVQGRMQDDRTLYGDNRHLRDFLRSLDGDVVVMQVGRRVRLLYTSSSVAAHIPALADGRPLQWLSLGDEVGAEDLPTVSFSLHLCAQRDQMQDVTYQAVDGAWRRAQLIKVKGEREENLVLAVITDNDAPQEQLLERRQRQRREALFQIWQLSTLEADLKSRTVTFAPEEEREAGEWFSQRNFPQDLIQSGMVMPESVEPLEQFAEKLFRGDLEGKADLWVRTGEDGAREQVRWTFHMVLDDHGHPVQGVGMSELAARVAAPPPGVVEPSAYDPNAALKMQLKMQEKYRLYAQKYQTELRRYRHDRRNTFIALSAMLQNNDAQGIRKYVNQLGEELQTAATVISTQNPALDALLSDKFAKAKSDGIQIRHMIGLRPNTEIDPIDFCIVMGCSLDNALEACQKVMRAGEHAFIDLQLIERRGVIVCKMRNSAVGEDRSGTFQTTKQDTLNHGFGLKNIRKIVNKYGGVLSLKQESGVFVTEFTMFTQ